MLLVVFAFLATLGVMGAMMYKEVSDVELQNTFYPGIYIDDIELYGYTPQQAYDMLLGKARAELSTWSLTVAYREQTWMLDTDKLGMNQSLETIVSDAVNTAFFKGRGDGDLMSIYNRYKTIAGLRAEPDRSYVSGVEKNTAVIDGMLNEIGQAVYQAPQDATRVFDTNRKNAIFVTEEVYGQEADIAKLKAQIMQKVNAMESGVIQVPLLPVTPSVTAEMLRGEYVKLSSFSTLINPNSTKARNENIAVGCDRFNGKTFQPGEKISFNQVVGRRTLENGFFEAEEQVYGVYEKGVGGGICQVSTTLYNAVIQAGLEVISRTNHSVPVGYVELGADATVYDDRIDFVFRNNTGMPIFITAIQTTRDAKKICQFEIYGRPDPNGFSYKLQHDKEEIPIPAKVERVRDKNGQYVTYTDQEKEVKGSVGHKVKTYLLTIDKGGNVLKRSDKPISESYYPPIPTRIYTGAQTRR
ncbi:MAG: VanW family protein [Firmicutes bacterium]|nr:VanW family protein [Bacillota bacterium]